ncbi:hypothetical protein C9I49_25690 [Pseudomonas prosekii]|uniref:Uncharacterized protein n=1 Tax=Pseudomonas prosekii TaxID=1148509 RepID=A0A2U2D150_9PSED|nr:hypothetical protein C9I49_25690 [Pseudomonas prosekii]
MPAERTLRISRLLPPSTTSIFSHHYLDRTAKNLASKPFTKPIVVKSEMHQDLADEYVKAVDGKGTSLTGLCSTTFEDALWNDSPSSQWMQLLMVAGHMLIT